MQTELETAMLYIAFFLSILNFIIAIVTLDIRRARSLPALQIDIEVFPPYELEEEETVIRIKNIGGRTALIDKIEVRYSPLLDEPILISELKNKEIDPNWTVSETIRLPDPVLGVNSIRVTITYRYGWIRKTDAQFHKEQKFVIEEK